MMKTNIKIVSVLIIVIGLLVGFKELSSKNTDSREPIKIGASISLTGDAADFGEMSKMAMEMAVEEINAKGGIEGRQVKLYIEDDQTTPQGSLSAYQKLTTLNDVNAVIGGIFDFTAQPLLPLAKKDQITFISPVNFVIDNAFEMNEHTFVMYPRFDTVVNELESVIKDMPIETLGMLRFESSFSESIQYTLKNVMTNLGRKPLIAETYAEIGGSDFRTNILKLNDKNLDAVFLDMLDFDILKYLRTAKELGFKKQIIGYTTIRDVLEKEGGTAENAAALEGAIMLDWEVPNEKFDHAFRAKYGMPSRRGANKSYDAIYVLAEAIAKTGTKAEVAAYIKSQTFKTVNGEFSFSNEHAVQSTPVKVFKVSDGKLVEIKSN
jgi:branched-chain amino acid transport system substrate-binding protein